MGCSASIDRAEPELHEPPQRPDRSQLPPAAAKPQLLGELDGNAHMLRLRSLYDDTQPRKSAGAVVQEPPAAATAAVVDVRRSRASVDQELCLAREAVAASTNVYGAADPETLNAVREAARRRRPPSRRACGPCGHSRPTVPPRARTGV